MLDVKTYRGLGTLPSAYSDVFAEASGESVFLTREWFDNFERTILNGAVATVYGVETQSLEPEPVAALVLNAHERDGLVAPRRLTSLTNYYTCFYGIARKRQVAPSTVVESLASALWVNRTDWDVLDLRPLVCTSADFVALKSSLSTCGVAVQPYFCFGNWYLDVGGRSFSEYLSSLSSVLRKNVPYNLRRFERSAANRVEIVTAPADADRALSEYESVYRASWKIPEAYPEFIRGLVRSAAEVGWLRLGIAYVDGRPAAAQIWLVCSGIASIYKIAYDEQYSKLSVGSVLTARLLEHAIDIDRVAVVDYLSGDDEYKSKWMSARREFWGLLAFNPRNFRGALQLVRHVGGRFAKDKVRALSDWGRRIAAVRGNNKD